MKRRAFITCTLGTAGLAGLGWKVSQSSKLKKVSRSSRALGSQVHLTVYAKSHSKGEDAIDAALAAIDHVEDLMSLYREDSQLSRLNREGTLLKPAAELVEMLQLASDLSRQSEGAFDITVQPLWELHARHAQRGTLPSPAELQAARAQTNWQHVHIENEGIWLEGGAQITLNGIAQGYAADAARAALAQHGIEHAILDTGEVSTLGSHVEHEHWKVGIKHPRQGGHIAIAQLGDRCLATSGDYETTFSADRSSHHLFDPSTGKSATSCASVSVIAPTAMQADALSTACFVLGVERGMQLIQATPNADALFVDQNGQLTRSADFPLQTS